MPYIGPRWSLVVVVEVAALLVIPMLIAFSVWAWSKSVKEDGPVGVVLTHALRWPRLVCRLGVAVALLTFAHSLERLRVFIVGCEAWRYPLTASDVRYLCAAMFPLAVGVLVAGSSYLAFRVMATVAMRRLLRRKWAS